MRKVLTCCLLVSMTAFVLTGCGDSVEVLDLADPLPASGIVTLDSKPLGKALINFSPDGGVKGPGSSAITDENGKFDLITVINGESKPGAVPGAYRVTISSLVGPDGNPVVPDGETPPAMMAAREILPERYSNPAQTELTATVSESAGTFNFDVFQD